MQKTTSILINETAAVWWKTDKDTTGTVKQIMAGQCDLA